MACTKSEIVAAINAFGAARVSQDENLINYAASMVNKCLSSLEFSEEDDVSSETEKA